MNVLKISKRLWVAVMLLMLSFGTKVRAQSAMDSAFLLNDTIRVLTLDQFYKIILTNHPVVKQAGLLDDIAQQEIRLAKGSFDPKIAASFDHKEFEDKTYYSKLDAYVSFPTWFPVNPKIGYQQNGGDLLNAEDAIPGGNQLYTGISVPVGKGLLTDERRAAVRQAELFANSATADQIKMINKILLDGSKDYWEWYYAYYQYRLSIQAVAIAETIFSRIKINMQQGEAAVIDTVQAKIILQSRRVELQEALLDVKNSGIMISNYLWNAQGDPVQLGTDVAPIMTPADQSLPEVEALKELVATAKENHPDLMKFAIKLRQLEVERSLAREFMKPQLDLNYFLLSQPSAPHQLDPINDYKLGLDFSFPVFMRKERSKLALTKIKTRNTQFQRSQSEREIVNQVQATFNELTNTIKMIEQQSEVVGLYNRLLTSELLNLENGESDLFRINIQQEKLLVAQTKLLKLRSEVQKLKSMLYWAAGIKNLAMNIE